MKPVENMSYLELVEAQMRHKKMLSNKILLQRLPDKGVKVMATSKKIEERLLELQKETDELSQMFTGMNLSCSRVNVNQMEWTGKVSPDSQFMEPRVKCEEEDEENETDIVKILRTANEHSKIVVDERKPPDEVSHPNGSAGGNHSSQHSCRQHLIDKVEHMEVVDRKFKPFKTLNHEKSISSTLPPNWENTAATPPLFKYNDGVKLIKLEESLELQVEIEEKLKHLEVNRSGFSKLSEVDNVVAHPDEKHEVYDDESEGAGKGLAIVVMSTEEINDVD